MRVVIAGGHGKIALILTRLLATRGAEVHSLIRDPGHAGDVKAVGAEPVLLDLEHTTAADLAAALQDADAAVFAAGAGPGSDAARKYAVDRDGSVLLAEAAERAGVERFVQISAMGAGRPPKPGSDQVWAAYVAAKTQAEDDLRNRSLEWTILRPGGLTDATGVGHVSLAAEALPPGTVPREDVAAVIAELLSAPGVSGLTLYLTEGPTPIPAAVAQLRLDSR
jgi:uncharacterized protein YbjT (DUF2867 family)